MKIGSKLPLQIHVIRAKLSQITHDGHAVLSLIGC